MYLNIRKSSDKIKEFHEGSDFLYFFEKENLFVQKDADSIIENVSRINFFVGSNNSGKSRFLRGLFKIDDDLLVAMTDKLTFGDLLGKLKSFEVDLIEFFNNEDFKGIFSFLNKLQEDSIVEFDLMNNQHRFSELFKSNDLLFSKINSLEENFEFYHSFVELNVNIERLRKAILFFNENKRERKLYIPVLRNLTKNQNLSTDLFDKIIEQNYNIKSNVFTGLDLYNELLKLKTSPVNERKKIKAFEKFLSETFFENQLVEITASNTPEHTTILFSLNEIEFPIFNIGDGIQQLILILFPIFTAKDNTWFFIEEPETHLHPGLQRLFIETLLKNSFLKEKKHKYFFTTHSNHFLDVSLDSEEISVYQFQKEGSEKFRVKNIRPNKKTLDLLGVNNSSVFLANSSIWVEGPTDRKYVSKFLKLYCIHNKLQNLKEDIDFAFFEYGGNLIEHYLFDKDFDELFSEKEVRDKINSFALSNKIYLLADNDNAKGKKLMRRQELEKLSSDKYFKYQNTDYKEIENLLPVSIIKSFLRLLVINEEDLKKIDNISFKHEDYFSIGLGRFIMDLFDKNDIKKYKSFKVEGNGETLKTSYKSKLCEMFVDLETTYKELVSENDKLNDIVEDLYYFIKPKDITWQQT
ncbi:AAA family ATPase [Flavobacterium sp. U410]